MSGDIEKMQAGQSFNSQPAEVAAGSFFGGFRTPALLPGVPLAPGRHPKPFP
jgi:hypothetical protein